MIVDIDFTDCNGLDMIEKDIVIENDLCGNKGNGKTPLFTGSSTNKSTAVECIGKRCAKFYIIVISTVIESAVFIKIYRDSNLICSSSYLFLPVIFFFSSLPAPSL